jgi:hypothetical protein
MRTATAAVLLALATVGCGGPYRTEQAAATTTATTVALTLGEDPTKPTTTTSAAASLLAKVTGSLRAHGFQVAGVKKVDPEGGRLFGMTHSWDLRINGVEGGVRVFADVESLQGWLETAGKLGGVVVFATTDVWAITLDSDSADRARSVKLAGEIGRALYEDWQGRIRTIATS